jgi:malate dehydrogenase
LKDLKISIIGAGNVGATAATAIAQKELCNQLVLLDVRNGIAEGKALDMWQSAPLALYDTRSIGVTDDFSATANSQIVVITSGMPRKPGMNREDLVSQNARIVQLVTRNVMKYSPDAIILVVSNPLDVMAYCAYLTAQCPPRKVLGMAGLLDTARYRAFIADAINCSVKDIQAVSLGGHGDTMVPLPRYTTVSGVPLRQFLDDDTIHKICERTRYGGGELVNLMGTSAWVAPGYATARMVESIVLDQRRIMPASVFMNGEYGIKDIFFGVPVKIGRNGVEEILEIELNDEERAMVDQSAISVKETTDILLNMNLF